MLSQRIAVSFTIQNGILFPLSISRVAHQFAKCIYFPIFKLRMRLPHFPARILKAIIPNNCARVSE